MMIFPAEFDWAYVNRNLTPKRLRYDEAIRSGQPHQVNDVKGPGCLDVPEPNGAVSAAGNESAAGDLHSPHGLSVALIRREALVRIDIPGLKPKNKNNHRAHDKFALHVCTDVHQIRQERVPAAKRERYTSLDMTTDAEQRSSKNLNSQAPASVIIRQG